MTACIASTTPGGLAQGAGLPPAGHAWAADGASPMRDHFVLFDSPIPSIYAAVADPASGI